MDKYKYIKNIDNTVATMYLYDEIGYDNNNYGGIDGRIFAYEIDWIINNNPQVKKINVRINSPGGNVVDGYSILSSINNVNQNVKGVWIDTYIDGIAASTAGWIALSGRNVYMYDYAILMIHSPGYANQQYISQKDKEILDVFKESIITIFQAKTKLTREEINSMMEQETWMDASTALEKGFVDKIISSGRTTEKPTEATVENYWKILKNSISIPTNKPAMDPTTQVKKRVLSSEISNLLGVKNHTEAVMKIRNLQESNESHLKEIESLKKELKDAQNKINEHEKSKALSLIENAIQLKKIANEQKEVWLSLAEQNYEQTKKALEAITPLETRTPPRITDNINKKTKNESEEDDKDDWDYMTWAKKDPKGLEKIKNEDPERFKLLQSKMKK